jgi:hypothetical protein
MSKVWKRLIWIPINLTVVAFAVEGAPSTFIDTIYVIGIGLLGSLAALGFYFVFSGDTANSQSSIENNQSKKMTPGGIG